MFSVQPQRNNDRRETSESAGQNKSQRQTIGVDGAQYRLAVDSHPRDTAAADRDPFVPVLSICTYVIHLYLRGPFVPVLSICTYVIHLYLCDPFVPVWSICTCVVHLYLRGPFVPM